VIHNYRWRLGLAEGEPKYDDLEKRLAGAPVITRAYHHAGRRRRWRSPPGPRFLCQEFSGKYSHRNIKGGVGHNLPKEAPQAFAEAVINVVER